ncbi:hypothetical protein B0H14DRAFT_2664187, partial [Mycena olivaceomarginata]
MRCWLLVSYMVRSVRCTHCIVADSGDWNARETDQSLSGTHTDYCQQFRMQNCPVQFNGQWRSTDHPHTIEGPAPYLLIYLKTQVSHFFWTGSESDKL